MAFHPPEVPGPGHPSLSQLQLPPVPIVYEKEEPALTLRAYAAIQLRVPESGIGWLDEMIRRSRELDRSR